ncbi:MAG: fasciclin domain-containing protein [Dysgonamonadaceae bacterium]|jgi:uncharacterized surface protein with fasciclin (FAS1) repeats|nr:fasciclin domain-containing protein [Dysgonamonadaceae bacterium]
MKTTGLQKKLLSLIFCLLPAIFFFSSCEKMMDGEIYQVYDEKMIDELMEEQQLSAFLSVVQKAELTGTIHAYGTYTLFAPTDEAIKAYLQENGKSGVDALTKEEAEAIVKYHLIRDTLATTDFIDGRLASPNFLKKYLTTKNDDGKTYRINRQANIVDYGNDIRGGNGILHIIDRVLTPPKNSITDAIRALPDDYSLMKSLFEQSELADSLSVEREDFWFTFFIQDDKAFEEAGIHTIDDLLAQLRENTPAVEDPDTLIRNFVGYHAINSLLYVADLFYISSMQTLAPKQVITFKRNQNVVLLNEWIQGQIVEPGVSLDRESEFSDLSCSNGVIHKINGNIQIKNRTAYRIYWDLAEQPEMMALKTFRTAGTNVGFASGDLSEIQWGGSKAAGSVYYYCGSDKVFDEKAQYVYSDYIHFVMSTNTIQWMEMKTPVLVEGKYKVWLCYRRLHDMSMKTTFKQEGYDDQVLPYVFNLAEYMPNPEAEGSSHEQIEIDGWKQYNAKKFSSVMISHLLGIIDVQTTGKHTLRFDVVSTGHSYDGNWDMIQFIPIDEDQLWPRVDMKGNWIGPEVRNCEIFPYDDCGDPVEE